MNQCHYWQNEFKGRLDQSRLSKGRGIGETLQNNKSL